MHACGVSKAQKAKHLKNNLSCHAAQFLRVSAFCPKIHDHTHFSVDHTRFSIHHLTSSCSQVAHIVIESQDMFLLQICVSAPNLLETAPLSVSFCILQQAMCVHCLQASHQYIRNNGIHSFRSPPFQSSGQTYSFAFSYAY